MTREEVLGCQYGSVACDALGERCIVTFTSGRDTPFCISIYGGMRGILTEAWRLGVERGRVACTWPQTENSGKLEVVDGH